MIRATFLTTAGQLCGFTVQGHAGQAEYGRDIVCAAVSSAVYLTANTLTEVCGVSADIQESDGRMAVRINSEELSLAQITLRGLQIHLEGLSAQYPQFIHLQQTEV